jgi:hypothetical protein
MGNLGQANFLKNNLVLKNGIPFPLSFRRGVRGEVISNNKNLNTLSPSECSRTPL